jgi:DNA-binding GntR family transcriptional regulator
MALFSLEKMITHDSAVPVYRQLAGILRDAIDAGQIAAGAPLPSESTLMQEYGIGRDSVRKAMDVLRDEGLVITVQGKGSFAAEG